MQKKNIARGDDIIILERRSWIIISKRLQKDETGRRYRVGLVETFLYSLETILSTTFSIESFNESLEEEIKKTSYDFNSGIEKFYASGFTSKIKRLGHVLQLPLVGRDVLEYQRDFIILLSRARSISPCEDITTSLEAHIKSSTAINAVISTKKNFGLEKLISLARERMRNYNSFLMTGHDIIMKETTRIQSYLLLILTALLVIVSIILIK